MFEITDMKLASAYLQFVKQISWGFPVQSVPQKAPVGHVTGHIMVSGVTRNALPDVYLGHVMSWTVPVNVRKGIEAVNVTSQVSYTYRYSTSTK
jgi:hypothetical protein